MSNRYTAYHYNGSQIHIFPTDSLSEAHHYLLHQATADSVTPKSILAIMEGPDDQIIYFKRSVPLLAQLKSYVTTRLRNYFGESVIYSIKKRAFTSPISAN